MVIGYISKRKKENGNRRQRRVYIVELVWKLAANSEDAREGLVPYSCYNNNDGNDDYDNNISER